MKIYTKKGDAGQTSLIGGTRVPKHHIRIEAYGTIDELNSWIGLLRDQVAFRKHLNLLLDIQDRLFTIGSLLAADPEKSKMELPKLDEQDVIMLEKAIDEMEEKLPVMKSFVLPGGDTQVSYCHITRCVCRRAERMIVNLNDVQGTDELILKYINRLSDFLFVLSRWISKECGATETPWHAKL
ncbi:MAG TPA: cob(I)yrinic acid a,c-diamide adenosyltransferase [Bacteroidia bacterium]|nr:cob(I)yrinic acid a,c-diamide adenosyltransferase [Bacteroidia bacterium]HNS13571.1 cob(I)yrinic acid a,c-diamide adenosyltransferase [Bacteroidia bacterium]